MAHCLARTRMAAGALRSANEQMAALEENDILQVSISVIASLPGKLHRLA